VIPQIHNSPEDRAGYSRNLIGALQLHSPDSLYSAVNYLHLTGLYLPILPMLAHWNDRVIEKGDREEIQTLYAVLADTITYIQGRLHTLESQTDDPALSESGSRLAIEFVTGMLATVRIIVRNRADQIVQECVQALALFLDQYSSQLEGGQNQPNLAEPFRQLQLALSNKQWELAEAEIARMGKESSGKAAL
jgi:hypothetical protein